MDIYWSEIFQDCTVNNWLITRIVFVCMLVFIHVCLLNILRVYDICLIEIQMLPTFRQFQISKMHYACIVNIYCRYAMIINWCWNFLIFSLQTALLTLFRRHIVYLSEAICVVFFPIKDEQEYTLGLQCTRFGTIYHSHV